MDREELQTFWKETDGKYGLTSLGNLQDLMKVGEVTPFIGAGMSVDFGYPTWDGFLDRAIREEVDDARQGELQALRTQKEFLPLAEKLDAYTNGGAGELIAAVFHESKMKPVEAPEDHYCRLLQKIMTG